MYINSTNVMLKSTDYNDKVLPNWFTSEKYFNCEYFYMNQSQKKRKLFGKRNKH
jgi:hypothetical protein